MAGHVWLFDGEPEVVVLRVASAGLLVIGIVPVTLAFIP